MLDEAVQDDSCGGHPHLTILIILRHLKFRTLLVAETPGRSFAPVVNEPTVEPKMTAPACQSSVKDASDCKRFFSRTSSGISSIDKKTLGETRLIYEAE